MTTNTDHRTADELAEAIRSGDTSVTAEDLVAARAREEYEQLLIEAKSREEMRRIEAERAEELAALRTDIERLRDEDVAQLHELAAGAAAQLNELTAALLERNGRLKALTARARALGVQQVSGGALPADPSGLGWHATPGRDPVLYVDDAVLSTRHPLDVLNSMVRDLVGKHRLHERDWKEGLAPSVDAQLDGLVHRRQPVVEVTVRLVQRWARHQAGKIVTVDASTAKWLAQRGIGQPIQTEA